MQTKIYDLFMTNDKSHILTFKGIVYPEIKVLSSFSHPDIVPLEVSQQTPLINKVFLILTCLGL